MFKYKYSKLYWFLKELDWLGVYFSPFKFFLPKLYIGKTTIGTPYFFPRKWIKATPERAHQAVLDYIKRENSYNKLNPNYARKIKPYDEVFKEKMKYTYAVPLKIGFSFCSLGWKTKWESYRHEYNPIWSFVFFGYQVALIFRPEHDSHYWECWLNYEFETDKSKSPKERVKQAREKYSCRWKTYKDDIETKICYWDLILKKKWKNN